MTRLMLNVRPPSTNRQQPPLILRLVSIVFALLAYFLAYVRNGNRFLFANAKIPLAGAAMSDFVPEGWEIEEEVAGDLNGAHFPMSFSALWRTGRPGATTDLWTAIAAWRFLSDPRMEHAGVSQRPRHCCDAPCAAGC